MSTQRLENILSIIKTNGYTASVQTIANALDVSPSTVRRNLRILEKEQRIKRSYGKAECLEEISDLLPFSIRFHTHIAEKMTACRLAASLVKKGDVVFLDASSTTYFLARFLREIPDVTVITNGVENINYLLHENVEVYSTGGKLSDNNRIAFVGKRAIDFVRSVHVNVFFSSAFSVNENGNVFDFCDEEIAVRQAMMVNSDKKVLIIDDKKINKSAPFLLANLQDFDYVVCNKPIAHLFNQDVKANFINET